VYAVPRLRKCTSSLFINIINLFGHLKGYDLILQCLEKQDNSKYEDDFDLNTLAILMQIVSIPFLVYHKDFIVEYGPQFVSVCKRRMKEAPEKSLRDVRREKIDAIIKSVDNLQRRLIQKEEREKETEVLRLEVSLMCLKSNYLERRIQGIRDLNQIIKNNRMMSIKSFTPHFLIEWMQTNEVFNILFDTKKTHLQLV
jgi:ubiquitin carboxyl-terminal hydrolase 34